MRTITTNALPEDIDNLTLVKSSERKLYEQMNTTWENTNIRCDELQAETEEQCAKIIEESKKQGFVAGFQLAFDQLMQFFQHFQRSQQQRQTEFHQHIADALQKSLNDPAIVELIIQHLLEKCGTLDVTGIVLPKKVLLPADMDLPNIQFTNQQHITVQNEQNVIRFPSDVLCQQWLQEAEDKTISYTTLLDNLTRETLTQITNHLLTLTRIE